MKVKCIDNSWNANLTLGKIYNVLNSDHDSHYIVSDSGKKSFYYKRRFEIIKEEPMEYIFKVKDNTQEDKQVVEFSLVEEHGKIKLKANDYTILKITEDGFLVRSYCVSDTLGLKIDKDGKMVELK